jgi:hypothetical protein
MEVFLLSLVLRLNVASHDDRYVSFTYLDYVIEALRYKLTIYDDVGSTHSETSVCPNETTRRYEGCHLHTHRRESLKSHKLAIVFSSGSKHLASQENFSCAELMNQKHLANNDGLRSVNNYNDLCA